MDNSLFFSDDQHASARHFNAFLLQQVEKLYSHPDRHYHVFDHIREMILIGKKVFNLTFQQYLAILFHDAVYNPRGTKNEELSAQALFNCVTQYKGPLTREDIKFYGEVAVIINDTKDHYYPTSEASRVVLDLDLERLARSLPEVEHFTNLIRQEYYFVDDETFKTGRKEFYKQFLNIEHPFSTEYGRQFWEPKAQENVNILLNRM